MTDTNAPTEQQGRNRSGTGAASTGTGTGVSVAAAAAALGISERAVRKRISAGTISASRDSGVWRVHLDVEPGPVQGRGRAGTAGPQDLDGRDLRLAALEAENAALRDELVVRRREMQQLLDTIAEQASTLRASHAPAIPAAIIETASYAPGAPQRTETARSATNPAPVDNLTLNATPEVERQPAPGRWDRLVEGVRGLVGRGQ